MKPMVNRQIPPDAVGFTNRREHASTATSSKVAFSSTCRIRPTVG